MVNQKCVPSSPSPQADSSDASCVALRASKTHHCESGPPAAGGGVAPGAAGADDASAGGVDVRVAVGATPAAADASAAAAAPCVRLAYRTSCGGGTHANLMPHWRAASAAMAEAVYARTASLMAGLAMTGGGGVLEVTWHIRIRSLNN